jgi:hypothetical protein
MKRIVEFDPVTGILTKFEYDPLTDTTIVSREQDVEQILEANKILANNTEYSKDGIKKEMWHYATIPNIVQEQLLRMGIDMDNKNHQKKFYQVLNSPEYDYLRTTTKKHWPRI